MGFIVAVVIVAFCLLYLAVVTEENPLDQAASFAHVKAPFPIGAE